MESDSEQSDEYRPSDISDDVGSEEDSDEDYSSLAEDESESGERTQGVARRSLSKEKTFNG